MTNEKLMKKAQELIGSWIYDKTDQNEYLYAYDFYDWCCEDDVKLCCIAISSGDPIFLPYIKETEIWMSEYHEYYRKLPSTKCIKAWEKLKEYYDKMFKGNKE
jgi:mitochondrial fission protein ELM1